MKLKRNHLCSAPRSLMFRYLFWRNTRLGDLDLYCWRLNITYVDDFTIFQRQRRPHANKTRNSLARHWYHTRMPAETYIYSNADRIRITIVRHSVVVLIFKTLTLVFVCENKALAALKYKPPHQSFACTSTTFHSIMMLIPVYFLYSICP